MLSPSTSVSQAIEGVGIISTEKRSLFPGMTHMLPLSNRQLKLQAPYLPQTTPLPPTCTSSAPPPCHNVCSSARITACSAGK